MSNDYGFFCKDVYAKVTLDPGKYGKIIKIPCSIGFKNQDKWANEFFDVIVFEALHDQADGISKGDKIKVSGRVTLTEWANKSGDVKKSWQILATEIMPDHKAAAGPFAEPLPMDDSDIPF